MTDPLTATPAQTATPGPTVGGRDGHAAQRHRRLGRRIATWSAFVTWVVGLALFGIAAVVVLTIAVLSPSLLG
jgi:hypothetical protein